MLATEILVAIATSETPRPDRTRPDPLTIIEIRHLSTKLITATAQPTSFEGV
jgi:hypothetical protein